MPKPSPMLMKFTLRLSRSSLTGPLILRLVPSVLRLARPRPNSFAAQNHHVHRGAFPKSRSSSPGWQVCTRRLAKNALGATMRASARSRPIVAKAASISPIVVALNIWIWSPMAGAASCTSRNVGPAVPALAGLTRTAIRTAFGTKSCKSRSPLAATSALKRLMPVKLPPGRARLATRPSLTGSSPTPKTMGIVVVAALAASVPVELGAWRSRPLAGGPDRPPAPAGDRIDPPASGIRSSRFVLRRSRLR